MFGGATAFGPIPTELELSVAEYARRNVHLTTSGFFEDALLRCAIDVVGADRIMFAVDHPFSDGAAARRWLDATPVSEEDRAAIAHGNAERLLRI